MMYLGIALKNVYSAWDFMSFQICNFMICNKFGKKISHSSFICSVSHPVFFCDSKISMTACYSHFTEALFIFCVFVLYFGQFLIVTSINLLMFSFLCLICQSYWCIFISDRYCVQQCIFICRSFVGFLNLLSQCKVSRESCSPRSWLVTQLPEYHFSD